MTASQILAPNNHHQHKMIFVEWEEEEMGQPFLFMSFVRLNPGFIENFHLCSSTQTLVNAL